MVSIGWLATVEVLQQPKNMLDVGRQGNVVGSEKDACCLCEIDAKLDFKATTMDAANRGSDFNLRRVDRLCNDPNKSAERQDALSYGRSIHLAASDSFAGIHKAHI